MDMYNDTKRKHIAVPLLFVAFAMVLSAAPADANDEDPIFTINHYWTYHVPEPNITVSVNVLLMDQFGLSQHNALVLDRFAIPVDKNNEEIPEPRAHLSWWRLVDGTDSPFRRVVVTNQFGEHELEVFEAEYLLAPALKNPDGGDPDPEDGATGDPELDGLDHYKCYRVEGASVDRVVTLSDQFQLGAGDALEPVYLCNPVDKIRQDTGGRFPIVKPTEHLVCYNLLIPPTPGPGLIFRDQFAEAQIPLDVVDLLCVPSTKEQVVQVEDGSWGKVKSIYR